MGKKNISSIVQKYNIQEGDLLYFSVGEDMLPYHSTIITKIEDNKIYYSGHTNNVHDKNLEDVIKNDYVFIIRIRDDAS